MKFAGTLKTLVNGFQNVPLRPFPPYKPSAVRSLMTSLFALVPGVVQGSVAQNAGTNIAASDLGFSPKFVLAWNATTPAFHVWFNSLGAGKSVNLFADGDGSAGAVAANGVTKGADDNSVSFGSGIAAEAETIHYLILGV